MTIRVDIGEQTTLAELLAHIEAGEEVVLARGGETIAIVRPHEPSVKPSDRIPGPLSHLGPMEDPDVFFHPDPEFIELAESRDEDDFYRPLPSGK